MLDELTPEQFDEWRAYNQLEPFGATKQAERDAHLLACVVNLTAEEPIDPSDVLAAWHYHVDQADGDDVLDEDQTFAVVCAGFGVA